MGSTPQAVEAPPVEEDFLDTPPRDILLLYLAALGHSDAELGRFFNLSPKQVRDLLRLPSMQKEFEVAERRIQEWVGGLAAEILGGDAVEAYFKSYALVAAKTKVRHMEQVDDLGVSSRAATDVLEFAGHGKKAVSVGQLNVINLPETQAQLLTDTLAEVKQLPVPVAVEVLPDA